MQELARMLATSEVQVAGAACPCRRVHRPLCAGREQMKTAPQIEAEAAQLNRDYAIHKKNYEDLVQRRQSAVMSGELDVASGVADFRLIDPPRVSTQAGRAQPPAAAGRAPGVALGAGLGFAFAASQLRPVLPGCQRPAHEDRSCRCLAWSRCW